MGRGPGSNGGVPFYTGEIKNLAFFQTRKFSKTVKESMKNLYFFEKFKGNFAIFWKIYKIFQI